MIKISNLKPKTSKLKIFFNKLKSKSSNQNNNLEINENHKTNDTNLIDKKADLKVFKNINNDNSDRFSEFNTLDDSNNNYFVGSRNLLIKVEKAKFKYPILKSVTLFAYANLPILQNLDVSEKIVKFNSTIENICTEPISVVVDYKEVTLKPYISYSVVLYNDEPNEPISDNYIDTLDIYALEKDSFLADSFKLCLPLNSTTFKPVDFLMNAIVDLDKVSPVGEFGDYYLYEVNVDFKLTLAPPIDITNQFTIKALNKALGRPEDSTDPFTRGELESITTLDLAGGDREDFVVLKYMPNLTYLDISKTNANNSDLIYVGNLLNLEILIAQENSITDISALSNLFKLKTLDLSNPSVSTFNRISTSQNIISDISPLAYLIELSYLDLAANIISDVSPLSRLTNLYHLDLSYNLISDISVLSSLVNLSYLNISVNKIFDISYLKNLHATIDALSQTIDLDKIYPQFDNTFMLELDFLKDLSGFVPCIDFISNNGSCYEGESCDCSTILWDDIVIPTDAYFKFSDTGIFSGIVNVTLVLTPL